MKSKGFMSSKKDDHYFTCNRIGDKSCYPIFYNVKNMTYNHKGDLVKAYAMRYHEIQRKTRYDWTGKIFSSRKVKL